MTRDPDTTQTTRVVSEREREALRIIVRMAIDQLMRARTSASTTTSVTTTSTSTSTQEAA